MSQKDYDDFFEKNYRNDFFNLIDQMLENRHTDSIEVYKELNDKLEKYILIFEPEYLEKQFIEYILRNLTKQYTIVEIYLLQEIAIAIGDEKFANIFLLAVYNLLLTPARIKEFVRSHLITLYLKEKSQHYKMKFTDFVKKTQETNFLSIFHIN
ncbi:MAG TPA: hypothetical protein PLH65_00210 [bacterium]|nr:hypothetical protein [bacterium]HPN67125.1 hypothetical protein [bacterium]